MPWTTQSFSTSRILSSVAPAFSVDVTARAGRVHLSVGRVQGDALKLELLRRQDTTSVNTRDHELLGPHRGEQDDWCFERRLTGIRRSSLGHRIRPYQINCMAGLATKNGLRRKVGQLHYDKASGLPSLLAAMTRSRLALTDGEAGNRWLIG